MKDICASNGLLPLEDAIPLLLDFITPITRVEGVPLAHAANRVLAAPVVSPLNIPLHDNSAMDGYALVLDEGEELTAGTDASVVARVLAGHPTTQTLKQGECARIMTGGDIPVGCTAVIMQEQVEVIDETTIRLAANVKHGQNIRPMGQDIAKGQEVLAKGKRLNPADIGVLASMGFASVDVFAKLKVAILSTGDELIPAGQALESGQLYESNTPTLEAVLNRLNVEVINFGIVADDEAHLTRVFIQADSEADVVITSGGVSVGEADYTKKVLETLGQLQFWKLAIKPGKPFAFGQLKNSYFIGLPGNPVSALVTLHQLGLPMLRKLAGETLVDKQRLTAITTENLKKSVGRCDFQRGIYSINESGQLEVRSTGAQGSGLLTSMSQANCYIVLEQYRGHVNAGETVTVELFDAALGYF
jgi:molybdopterin molybdotransferase